MGTVEGQPWTQRLRDVCSISTNKRRHAWMPIIEEIDLLQNNEVEKVITAIELAIPLYSDRKSKELLIKVIEAWAKVDSFVKLSVMSIARKEKEICDKALPSHERQVLVAWSCILIEKLLASGQKKAANKMIVLVSHLLTAALSDSEVLEKCKRIWPVHKHYFNSLFQNIKEDFNSIAKSFLLETTEPGYIRFLVERKEISINGCEEVREKVLTLFIERIITSKQKPLDIDIASFVPLMESLTTEDISQHVMPGVQRMLKRSPEVIIATLIQVLTRLKAPIDDFALDLLSEFILQLQSSAQEQRQNAVSASSALCKCINNCDVLVSLKNYLCDKLAGKAVRNSLERLDIVRILHTIVESTVKIKPSASAMSTLFEDVLKLYEAEKVDSVKCELLRVLKEIICNMPNIDSDVSNEVKKALSGKSDLRNVAIDFVLAISENDRIPKESLGLDIELLSIVSESVCKPAVQHMFPGTMLSILNLAKYDAKIMSELRKESFWQPIFKNTSPVCSAEVLEKYDENQCLNMAKVCRNILLEHNYDFVNEAAISRQLIHLSLMRSPRVHRASIQALKQCNAASTGHVTSLCLALKTILSEKCATELWSACMQHHASDCVLALAPVSQEFCNAQILGKVFLLAHHSCFLCNKKSTSIVFTRLLSHVRTIMDTDLISILNQFIADIFLYLFGVEGLASDDERDAGAASKCIGSLSQISCSAFTEEFMLNVTQMTAFAEHAKLSASDAKIYFTPPGELSSEFGEFKAQVVESKNVRRSKGRFRSDNTSFGGLDDLDDYVPEREVSVKPKATKPKGKGPIDPRERMRQEQLERESQIREKVTRICQMVTRVLRAINSIAHCSPNLMLNNLGKFSSISTPMLGSSILHEEALKTTCNLASCLPSPLQAEANSIASSVWLVLKPATEVKNDAPTSPLVQESIEAIYNTCNASGGLQCSVFLFCFPILKCIFDSQTLNPAHDKIVHILTLHVSSPGNWPFGSCAKAIFNMWNLLPSYRDQLQSALLNICENFTLQEDLFDICSGVLQSDANIRRLTMQCLQRAPMLLNSAVPFLKEVTVPLWIALHDLNDDVVRAADVVWKQYGHDLHNDFIGDFITYLEHPNIETVKAVAFAIAAGLKENPSETDHVLKALIESFDSNSTSVHGKIGIGLALKNCIPFVPYELVSQVIHFILHAGFVDIDEKVRESMLNVGISIVDSNGEEHGDELLKIFESNMNASASELGLSSESHYDLVKQGLVVLLGALARHFDSANEHVEVVVEQLIGALRTPSEIVQRSVSERLPPLVSKISKDKEKMETLVMRLLDILKDAETYGTRKGAAFGLSGVVKGLGISSFKNYGIMEKLKVYVEDKKDPKSREGALLAFECLCERLGRLFEPYIIHILPLLLVAFGDGSTPVRQAANGAAHVIMSKLSTQGMRLVLPALLKGLDEVAWRTKQGSVQLLGTMAYCAPKQLGTCLPTIVPKIGEVLKDPHPRVQEAAQNALNEIGNVIKNPEISQISPQLLSALADPMSKTKDALGALLTTKFINTIDAASLSLIVPILNYGLKEKATSSKKKAAQIVGSLCHLVTDAKDLIPYIEEIVPNLKKVLIDPIPEARHAAAKALGSIVRGIGPESMSGLLTWLLETVKTDSTTVEKNGAAQGLSEILSVLGRNHLDSLMPDILAGCTNKDSLVREGYLSMFKYLPFCMESGFQPYLSQVLPIIIDALPDDSEKVREASFNSAKTIVEVYAMNSLHLLLPAVEKGATGVGWRIRESSIELLGQLLFKIAGKVNIKTEVDEDEIYSLTDYQTKTLQETLGLEQRNRVLALLYLLRSDVSYPVRTAALQIWKTIVSNTPKTVNEIMEQIMDLIVSGLSKEGSDQQQTAATCLGELVRKLGDKVAITVFPMMERGLRSSSSDVRRGVSYGLSSVLQNVSKQQLVAYLPTLLPTVQIALCDPDKSVQSASADLMTTICKGASDVIQQDVLPGLLDDIQTEGETCERSLQGLCVILGASPSLVSSVIVEINTLPLAAFRAKAIGDIANSVPFTYMGKHLKKFLKPLLTTISTSSDEALNEVSFKAAETVVLNVEEGGLYEVMSMLTREFDDPELCTAAAKMIQFICKSSNQDLEEYVGQLINAIISVFATAKGTCLMECWRALSALVASIPKAKLATYVRTLKDAILSAREQERRKRLGGDILVAGFCEPPKALSAVLPIYLNGMLQAANLENKELAAEGLGELIQSTTLATLKPSLAQITGPLIRVLGDRYPWEVKLAILETLGILLAKAGLYLKPFVPQLQTTFLKALHDGSWEVRAKSAHNLGKIANMTLRVDQLVSDLLNTLSNSSDEVREVCIIAIGEVIYNSKGKVSKEKVTEVGLILKGILSDEDEGMDIIRKAGQALGQYGASCTEDELSELILNTCTKGDGSAHVLVILTSLLTFGYDKVFQASLLDNCIKIIKSCEDDGSKVNVAKAYGTILMSEAEAMKDVPRSMSNVAPNLMAFISANEKSEVIRETLQALQSIAQINFRFLTNIMEDLLPLLCSSLAQATGPTKVATEDLIASSLGLSQLDVDESISYLNTLKPTSYVKQQITPAYLRKLANRLGHV